MNIAVVRKIEQLADLAASGSLGAAAGFAVYSILHPVVAQPALGAYVAAAGGVSYLASRRVLAAIAPHSAREPVALAASVPADELLLDDLFLDAEAESRVVRLFDPPAEPQQRMPAHDATHDLHAALSKLRSSLR